MKQLLFSTDSNWVGFVLRLVIGFIMFPHGAQKLLGSFGGNGFSSTYRYFTDSMKLPGFIAMLIILAEFFGAVGCVIGFGSRIWAIFFIAIMTGAIITTNFPNGFFMNWFGDQKGEGYEYHLLMIGICIALIISGGGRYSFDSIIN